MKIKFLTLLSLVLLLGSCNKNDEGDSEMDIQQDEETTALESTALKADEVSNGLNITNAQKLDGAPPTSNSNLPFNILKSSTAVLNEGFDLELSTENEYEGIYLQIKDTDGNPASNYYDIAAPGRRTNYGKKNIFESNKSNSKMLETILEIGFNNTITPGIFCYDICVYDTDGNISQPQSVCITIQAFGGNSNFDGDWNLSRYQEIINGTTTTDVGLGEEFCETFDTSCNNGNLITINECQTFDNMSITFMSNGDYALDQTIGEGTLDYDQTVEKCMIINGTNMTYRYVSNGKWAFNDSENRLTLIEYSYTDYENGIQNGSGTNSNGQGNIIFDDALENVTNTSFTIVDEDLYEGMLEEYKLAFAKQ